MENDIKKLQREIEKIKQALINFRPDFKYDFCDHIIEEIKLPDNEVAHQLVPNPEPSYRCRKCGILLTAQGKVKVENIF